MSIALPEQFSALTPFAEKWAIDSEKDRRIMRMNSSQDELQSFYRTMKPILDDVVQYLNQFKLEEMAATEQQLLQMSLSLVEISVAVELFHNPWPVNAWPWDKFSVAR
ncbi:MAG: hypothetical protein JKY89_01635 [Immundisolibacteraceae bacterium]|nr:hypothetical protein [Immundisolibacteraceae bacterium]